MAAVFLVMLGVMALLLVAPLLQVVLLSFLIAFLVFIPSRGLVRRLHLPFPAAVLLIYLLIAALFVCAIFTLLPNLIAAFENLGTSLQASYQQFVTQLLNYRPQQGSVQIAGIPVNLDGIMPSVQQLVLGRPGGSSGLVSQMGNVLSSLGGTVLNLSGAIFANVAGFLTLLVTSFFVALLLLIDLPVSGGMMSAWVPQQYSRELAVLFAKLDRLWLGFFRAEVIVGMIITAGNLVIYLLLGVPSALPLALISGTIGLIPTIGGILALIPLIVVCLLEGSTVLTGMDHVTFALLATVITLVFEQIIYAVIAPRISGTAVAIPAVAVVIGVLAGLAIAGILGAILVVPIMGSIRVFVHYALSKIALRDPYPNESAPDPDDFGFFSHMLYVKTSRSAHK